MTASPRAVLDTNIVLSALLFAHGRLAPLRHAWHDRRFQPLVSTATVGELIRVLTYPKFRLSGDEQQELLADYLPYCTTVRMPAVPPRVPACRDPCDVPFLELAVAGKADCLVTGDRDVLVLGRRFSRPIVTAEQFLQTLGSVA